MTTTEIAERPFLRATDPRMDEVLPDGWITRPVGSEADRSMEVAFDPSRHDIAVVWKSTLSMPVGHGISDAGWRPLACTDTAQIWSRYRSPTISDRLRSTFHRPVPGPGVTL